MVGGSTPHALRYHYEGASMPKEGADALTFGSNGTGGYFARYSIPKRTGH
jgi:hypothetical protein